MNSPIANSNGKRPAADEPEHQYGMEIKKLKASSPSAIVSTTAPTDNVSHSEDVLEATSPISSAGRESANFHNAGPIAMMHPPPTRLEETDSSDRNLTNSEMAWEAAPLTDSYRKRSADDLVESPVAMRQKTSSPSVAQQESIPGASNIPTVANEPDRATLELPVGSDVNRTDDPSMNINPADPTAANIEGAFSKPPALAFGSTSASGSAFGAASHSGKQQSLWGGAAAIPATTQNGGSTFGQFSCGSSTPMGGASQGASFAATGLVKSASSWVAPSSDIVAATASTFGEPWQLAGDMFPPVDDAREHASEESFQPDDTGMYVATAASQPDNGALELPVADDIHELDDESSEVNINVSHEMNPDQCQARTLKGVQCRKNNVTTTVKYKERSQEEHKTEEEEDLERFCQTHINVRTKAPPTKPTTSNKVHHSSERSQHDRLPQSKPDGARKVTAPEKKRTRARKAKPVAEVYPRGERRSLRPRVGGREGQGT